MWYLHVDVVPAGGEITRWRDIGGGVVAVVVTVTVFVTVVVVDVVVKPIRRGFFPPHCGGIPPSGESVPVAEGGKKAPRGGGGVHGVARLHLTELLVGGLSEHLNHDIMDKKRCVCVGGGY